MTETANRPPNRLIDETSPYLLQHARNPVDWHPWGEAALSKARDEQRPIFLSIGYSACHWCHVMEHESFEDDEIAALMNRYFVNIKVDREERPDLDQIYMNSVTAMTGRGGWPMSVFLTPELKPFYGGTYWPPEPRMGMPGFRQVIDAIHDAWENRRDDVVRGADELTAAVNQMSRPMGEQTPLEESLLQNALQSLLHAADRTHGGFGSAPKFPHAMDLRLLLRLWKRFGSDDALQVTRLTLDKMARGGIYDHLGGGFHRYSTDATWLVPHFEKMLYDNALLCTAYLEAYQATGCEDYSRVVRETLDYVLREMTQPDGGFYSTQDADSEGVEGKFFVWSEDEIVEQLGEADARIFNACYDVSRSGNWEGKNILNRPRPAGEQAAVLDLSDEQLDEVLDRCRKKLFEVRSRRIAPGRDEKILTSWNGLMIAAMSLAAQVLGEKKYADAARKAADFVLSEMTGDDGRLLHSYKDGRARFNAYLDDYACMIDGLVELYQATFEAGYLTAAAGLCDTMLSRFDDADSGGFFYTSDDHEELVVRPKDSQDNATPSGNSMAACALLRLGRLCGRSDLEAKGVQVLESLSGQLKRVPMAGSQALIAVDFLLGKTYEVAVVDGERAEETEQVLSALARRFLPNKVVLRRPRDSSDDALPDVIRPLLQNKLAADGAPTIYLCQQGVCREPVIGVDGLESVLSSMP